MDDRYSKLVAELDKADDLRRLETKIMLDDSVRQSLKDVENAVIAAFGTEGAELLGRWVLAGDDGDDTLVAQTESIVPGANALLTYTEPMDELGRFELHVRCGACGHARTYPVSDLVSLSEALHKADLR